MKPCADKFACSLLSGVTHVRLPSASSPNAGLIIAIFSSTLAAANASNGGFVPWISNHFARACRTAFGSLIQSGPRPTKNFLKSALAPSSCANEAICFNFSLMVCSLTTFVACCCWALR